MHSDRFGMLRIDSTSVAQLSFGWIAFEKRLRPMSKRTDRDSIHCPFMIIGLKQVAIAVHRHLQAAMAGEGLHGLRA